MNRHLHASTKLPLTSQHLPMHGPWGVYTYYVVGVLHEWVWESDNQFEEE